MKESDLVKPLTTMAGGAPQWVAVILIVAIFVAYLWSLDQTELLLSSRMDLVANQRIDQCHEVQVRAVDAMTYMAQECREQHDSMMSLKEMIERRTRLGVRHQ